MRESDKERQRERKTIEREQREIKREA